MYGLNQSELFFHIRSVVALNQISAYIIKSYPIGNKVIFKKNSKTLSFPITKTIIFVMAVYPIGGPF